MKTPIKLKTPKQIELLKVSATSLSHWLNSCHSLLEQGILKTGKEVEEYLSNYMKSLKDNDNWSFPFPTQVNNSGERFNSKLCISVNDAIAHSRPSPDNFVIGDVVTIDAGLAYKGWCSDSAMTAIFGLRAPECKTSDVFEKQYLISGVNIAIEHALSACKAGNKVGQISAEIANCAKDLQLGNVTAFMGHGIGQKLHEPPLIPSDPIFHPLASNVVLRAGMVICLEPMFTLGCPDVVIDADGWTIFTADGSLAAHCEVEVLITRDGYELLTKLPKVY